ncbi:MAG: prepilin-type N-terminal cleavage/methylation domain-containing protein, partial [Acidobacteria bacterium]|nr:prepilin-type N-terminal cleavage/methylation domain-containing protein [Acidobacteriota bacterium]
MASHQPAGNAHGFALLEVIIASAIAATIAVGSCMLLSIAIQANQRARTQTVATLAAVRKMEELRSLEWGHVATRSPAISMSSSDLTSDLSNDPPTDRLCAPVVRPAACERSGQRAGARSRGRAARLCRLAARGLDSPGEPGGQKMIDQRGQGLIELLVATAIGLLVLGALLQFAVSAHTLTSVEGERADLQQRLRVALEMIRHDLMLAGAGPSRGPSRGPLNAIFPAVMPARVGVSGADPELSFHSDRISILYVPADAPQTRLISPMRSGASAVAIDGLAPGCRVMSACGFAPGMDVLIYEAPGVGGA